MLLSAAYCVVAVESVGRQIPMAFLERVKDDFNKRYGGGKAATAVAKSLNKEFGPKLKEHMQYCVDHPDEMNKLAKVQAQISEVKGVMMENIEKVLDRGEKIELLVDKTENLRSQAQDFRQQGTKIRRSMWLQNMKIKLIVLGIIIALILIIVVSVLFGYVLPTFCPETIMKACLASSLDKMFVYAAWYQKISAGFGRILKGSNGISTPMLKGNIVSQFPDHAEALAIVEALKWGRREKKLHLTINSDCYLVL
ncbi:hypothetical protein KSS87_012451 [Heliosperma pusillum]|nr:hypothetical protein KSS87_012451 [Heliosperma pusillum]